VLCSSLQLNAKSPNLNALCFHARTNTHTWTICHIFISQSAVLPTLRSELRAPQGPSHFDHLWAVTGNVHHWIRRFPTTSGQLRRLVIRHRIRRTPTTCRRYWRHPPLDMSRFDHQWVALKPAQLNQQSFLYLSLYRAVYLNTCKAENS